MKRQLYILLSALCLVSFFIGCDDNDDPLFWPGEISKEFGAAFSGTSLTLTYGGEPLTGKQVRFYTNDSKKASIVLKNTLPGEAETVISGIRLVEGDKCYTFSGQTEEGHTIRYSGTVSPDAMNLAFDVTLNAASQGGLSGTWNMRDTIVLDMENYVIVSSPVHLAWDATEEYAVFTGTIETMIHAFADPILCQVLQKVNFNPDGTITASYASEFTDEVMTLIMEYGMEFLIKPQSASAWKQSPKNLVYWYVRENTLYAVPNLSMIISQVLKDNGGTDLSDVISNLGLDLTDLLDADVSTVRSLLNVVCSALGVSLDLNSLKDEDIRTLMGYFKTGIPLGYRNTSEGLRVCLTRETLDPLIPIVFSMLPALQQMVDESGMGGLLSIFGISSLTDIEDIWAKTVSFELGLNLEN